MIEISGAQSIIVAVVGLFGTVSVALIGFIGGRGAVSAQLQSQLNVSFHTLTTQLQKEREVASLEVDALRGEVRNLEQHIRSLEVAMRGAGLDIPPRPKVDTVLFLERTTAGARNGEAGHG